MTGAPGFRRRQVRSWKSIGADHLRVLGGFSVTGRIDQRNGGSAVLAEVGISRSGFAVQSQTKNLAFGLVGILSGSEALAVAHREEQILSVGREGNLRAFLAALALGQLTPDHLEVLQSRGGRGGVQLGTSQGQAAAVITRLNVSEINTLVGCVIGRDEDAQHTVLTLPVDWRSTVNGHL